MTVITKVVSMPINRKRNTIGVIATIIFGLCVAVVLITAEDTYRQKHRPAPFAEAASFTSLPSPTPRPTPYWKTESYPIKSQAVALAVGQVWWQPLNVEENWRGARLIGRFMAQGGPRNDIYACVTDEDGLTNLRNGNTYNIWYESGRSTVNAINARLPTGRSYFVLQNRYAWFLNRAVTFDLRIEYDRLVYP